MRNNGKEVLVTRTVFEGISAVRDTGETNMFDRSCVMDIARGLDYSAAAQWIHDHPEEYFRGICYGFEVASENVKEAK